jgi:hypothetical protein
LLPPSGRRVGVHIPQPEEYEPVDTPVRFYEKLVCLAAQLLTIGALGTHNRAVELAAAASAVLLIALSLWKLFVPPRFSMDRSVFVFIGLLCLFLLWNP